MAITTAIREQFHRTCGVSVKQAHHKHLIQAKRTIGISSLPGRGHTYLDNSADPEEARKETLAILTSWIARGTKQQKS